jgi:2-(acetamidomethylene)succinate hydrolase
LRDDLQAVLAKISIPALLVRGKQSKLVSLEAWRKTKALRPDLPAVEIDDADHYVHEEQPAAVAKAILDFWTTIEGKTA